MVDGRIELTAQEFAQLMQARAYEVPPILARLIAKSTEIMHVWDNDMAPMSDRQFTFVIAGHIGTLFGIPIHIEETE